MYLKFHQVIINQWVMLFLKIILNLNASVINVLKNFPFENNTNLMVYIVIYIILKKQNEE